MVRVTLHYLSRKGSGNAPKHNKDPKEHARKLTHLYLNDQYIDSIVGVLKIGVQQNNIGRTFFVVVINELLSLFHALKNETGRHISLQESEEEQNTENGGISRACFPSETVSSVIVANGTSLYQRRTMKIFSRYLGHNSISVVEGLENLKCLQELHVEHQRLCPGEEIMFDPRSVAALGYTLEMLNLQGNGLSSLEDLVGLEHLRILWVSSNNLKDVTKIQAFLSAVPSLAELDMRDNPVILDYKNCNRILAVAHNLRIFNKKNISYTTLDFMRKFEEHQQKTSARSTLLAPNHFISSISELAHNLPEALAKDVTSSILRQAGQRNTAIKENKTQLGTPASELVLTVQSNSGPFFHFPAFKSSTCLQYDGHAIPKPFHRQIISGVQRGQRVNHLKNLSNCPFNIPNNNDDTRSDMEVVSKSNIPENVGRADCGDMEWGDMKMEPLSKGD
ncbi:Protein phosphatase 1 regulatory subunit 42 [Frankliniella fusca]|uniref:Protein phosphatase 1 regulatory subunit 42 n=1 Tax=Frankliniella fusca TaxID=407009 RepID=A0AAE1L8E2_9NEOP|nr:Protein phosphatase 1 regulatory subunit 42 [Frankliniella fusca]